MDYSHRRDSKSCNAAVKIQRIWTWPRTSFSIIIATKMITIVLFLNKAAAQDQNAPPVVYVRERNWRIPETEQVGQVIDRVRGEDPDNDDLVFGIEPRFLSPPGASDAILNKLPFRIDTKTGVVYLNESLLGRAGENFLIYITVSDGRYTAKTEVFINILGSNENSYNSFGSRSPPSISNVVQNISQFLPPFHKLPGVQSIRNNLPNRRPTQNLPPGFPENNVGYTPITNFFPNQPGNPFLSEVETDDTNFTTKEDKSTTTTSPSRTKLTPITSNATDRPLEPQDGGTDPITLFAIKSTTIPIVIVICGLAAAVAAICVFLCRRRLCAISKTLKKKSKEELAKKSNQSNLSSTLTDDSRNSMVMQQWNGPVAYGNRYVPWERDHQLGMMSQITSQLSTNAANGGDTSVVSNGAALGVTSLSGCVALGGNGSSSGFAGCSSGNSDRWEFPRHRLKFFNILGEGAFGQVWRCEATDIDGTEGVTTVAVKTLKESAAEIEKKDLISELEVMKSLDPHVNVVRLLGCCTDKDPTFVIIEYVNRGKLQTYLRNSRAERHYGNTHGKSNILTSGDLTSFMYQVAKGMDYLTSRGIIHRDLAARNILITDDHMCKVADFGFARDIITSKIYERKSEGKLPIRWMATESLYDNIFSVKSDIWSFGILMWEIVTLGSTPYPGISAADVMRKVRDGYRLEKPEHCRRELYNIMYYCWSQDASERPTFAEIIQMLDKLLHTEMDYIELELFPDHNYYNIVNVSGEKL